MFLGLTLPNKLSGKSLASHQGGGGGVTTLLVTKWVDLNGALGTGAGFPFF